MLSEAGIVGGAARLSSLLNDCGLGHANLIFLMDSFIYWWLPSTTTIALLVYLEDVGLNIHSLFLTAGLPDVIIIFFVLLHFILSDFSINYLFVLNL